LAPALVADSRDKEPAPRFHAVTTSGEKCTNDSVKGKVVLLEFWTTWCPYCSVDAPVVDKLGKEFEDKGLVLLTINVGESKKKVKKYLEEHPRACRVVLMEDTNLAAMYQANVYPIYVVIDRAGNIVGTRRGSVGERGLRRLLADAGMATSDDDS
jgi:thiol-disulfide isomerase/thioredoxin